MRCSDFRERLPELLEAELAPAEAERLERHLEACAGCAEERVRLRRALRALSTASEPAVPDLWARFSTRLGDSISCAESRELAPAYAASELRDERALSLSEHLARCQACAAELTAYQGAFSALQAAAEAPAVDLWPAFSERLAQEEAARTARAGLWSGLWESLRRPAALRPALQLAALALAVWSGSQLLKSGGTAAPVAPPAAIASREVRIPVATPSRAETPKLDAEQVASRGARRKVKPARRVQRPVAVAVQRPVRKPRRSAARPFQVARQERPAVRPPKPSAETAPKVLMAQGGPAPGGLTITDGGGAVLTTLPEEVRNPVPAMGAGVSQAAAAQAPAERVVRDEMVRAFGLMTRREDAAASLFGQETYGE
ncbi:MAG: zf-HC2 domain-containing protein [Armatimonadota bacterium]